MDASLLVFLYLTVKHNKARVVTLAWRSRSQHQGRDALD
jgi:hypothetical protein